MIYSLLNVIRVQKKKTILSVKNKTLSVRKILQIIEAVQIGVCKLQRLVIQQFVDSNFNQVILLSSESITFLVFRYSLLCDVTFFTLNCLPE